MNTNIIHYMVASLIDQRTAEIFMELNVHLTSTDGESLEDHTRYRHIIESCLP
jgi:hypothetical protein